MSDIPAMTINASSGNCRIQQCTFRRDRYWLAGCPKSVAELVKSFGRSRKTLPNVLTTFATDGYPDRLLVGQGFLLPKTIFRGHNSAQNIVESFAEFSTLTVLGER